VKKQARIHNDEMLLLRGIYASASNLQSFKSFELQSFKYLELQNFRASNL